jgi:hypothetical protein
MGWLLAIAILVALWYHGNYKGAMKMYEHERMLNQLAQGENYRRLVSFTHKGRKYEARIRRWDVPEAGPDIAELWCIVGSNPDGWTQFFLWEKDELKFVD